MTQDEIDTMWQKAMRQSIKEGEMFTRYQFAHLVADKATEEANARANASWTLMCKKMVAIEREALAQPEQEPVAWKHPDKNVVFWEDTKEVDEYHGFKPTIPLYTTPPQRKPLTDEQIDALALVTWWTTK